MSFLYNTLASLWNSLWEALGLGHKQGSLLLLGLDNAGKTTLLHKLASGGELRPFPPTDRPRHDTFTTGRIQFRAWDLGGHEAVRHLWEDYVPQVSAVLFLIDASDPNRFEESGYELDALIGGSGGGGGSNGADEPNDKNSASVLSDLPIALLLNKCDLEDAATTEDILEKIDYAHLQSMHATDKLQVFRISVLTGDGYPDAFRWVASFL